MFRWRISNFESIENHIKLKDPERHKAKLLIFFSEGRKLEKKTINRVC